MKSKIKFGMHIIFHPADGFWDMKREKKGSLKFCLILLLLNFITSVADEYAVGFIFDTSPGETADILFLLAVAVIPVLLLALANSSVTTFLEGDGTFKDVFMVGCYSMTPYIFARVIATVLSNVLSMEEGTYITIITAIGTLWTLMLMLIGIMEVHNYTASRTVASALLTVVSMVIIIFLLLLFLDMISRIFGFGYSVAQEIEAHM